LGDQIATPHGPQQLTSEKLRVVSTGGIHFYDLVHELESITDTELCVGQCDPRA
jgi:hypothetical protein